MPALGPPGRAGPVGKNIAGQELSGVRSSRGWWSNLSVRVLLLKSARNLPKPYSRGCCSRAPGEQLAEIPCSRPDTPDLTCRYRSACAVSKMLANAHNSRHQVIVRAGVRAAVNPTAGAATQARPSSGTSHRCPERLRPDRPVLLLREHPSTLPA